jgi:ectoine hydroxylase-related dioxygenase (phytanoyl-CoA dioxygenase family)
MPWHQDAAYWPLSPREHNITAWIALFDTDASNGCMRVIPGTHERLLEHGGELEKGDVLAQALTPEEITLNELCWNCRAVGRD